MFMNLVDCFVRRGDVVENQRAVNPKGESGVYTGLGA